MKAILSLAIFALISGAAMAAPVPATCHRTLAVPNIYLWTGCGNAQPWIESIGVGGGGGISGGGGIGIHGNTPKTH